jgi:hypothetical protein
MLCLVLPHALLLGYKREEATNVLNPYAYLLAIHNYFPTSLGPIVSI